MTGPRITERFIATIVITIALAVVAVLSFQRFDMETRPRTVEVAFPEKRLVEEMQKNPNALNDLKAAGVTTLVRVPYTLDDMIRYGLAEAWHPEKDLMEIRLADNQLTSNATVYLTGQFGMEALQIRIREQVFICDVRLPAPVERVVPDRFILEVPSGDMPEGFRRALLLPAGDWGKTHDLNQLTSALYSLNPDTVIPLWRGGINAVNFYQAYMKTPWLKKPVMAVPEFFFPRAGRTVLQRYPKRPIIRAHVVLRKIAARQSARQLKQRIMRAVVERGVDFVYVEPPANWTMAHSKDFFRELTIDLIGRGYRIGQAGQPLKSRTGHAAMAVIYAALGAVLFLFIWQTALWAVGFTGRDEPVDKVVTIRLRPAYFRWSAFGLVLALLIIHFEGAIGWAAKIGAWLIACLVPLLTVMLVPDTPLQEAVDWKSGMVKPIRSFFTMVLINTLAGMAIGVMLFHTNFIQRLDTFFGVKAAFVLPLLFAGIWFFPNVTDAAWWKGRWQGETRYWTMATLLLLGLGIFILVVRSGNAAWFPVSPWELHLRDMLESGLGIRPRWKEFLIGHPMMLIGLMGLQLTAGRKTVWPNICVVIGLIGQLSIINTFCHIHSPLHISLIRTVLGALLGTAIGLSGMAMVRWAVLARRR